MPERRDGGAPESGLSKGQQGRTVPPGREGRVQARGVFNRGPNIHEVVSGNMLNNTRGQHLGEYVVLFGAAAMAFIGSHMFMANRISGAITTVSATVLGPSPGPSNPSTISTSDSTTIEIGSATQTQTTMTGGAFGSSSAGEHVIAEAYGPYVAVYVTARSGSALYASRFDLTGPDGVPDGLIDELDIHAVSEHFGKEVGDVVGVRQADIDNDGDVDRDDLELAGSNRTVSEEDVIAHLGENVDDVRAEARADVNGDGKVDAVDVQAVAFRDGHFSDEVGRGPPIQGTTVVLLNDPGLMIDVIGHFGEGGDDISDPQLDVNGDGVISAVDAQAAAFEAAVDPANITLIPNKESGLITIDAHEFLDDDGEGYTGLLFYETKDGEGGSFLAVQLPIPPPGHDDRLGEGGEADDDGGDGFGIADNTMYGEMADVVSWLGDQAQDGYETTKDGVVFVKRVGQAAGLFGGLPDQKLEPFLDENGEETGEFIVGISWVDRNGDVIGTPVYEKNTDGEWDLAGFDSDDDGAIDQWPEYYEYGANDEGQVDVGLGSVRSVGDDGEIITTYVWPQAETIGGDHHDEVFNSINSFAEDHGDPTPYEILTYVRSELNDNGLGLTVQSVDAADMITPPISVDFRSNDQIADGWVRDTDQDDIPDWLILDQNHNGVMDQSDVDAAALNPILLVDGLPESTEGEGLISDQPSALELMASHRDPESIQTFVNSLDGTTTTKIDGKDFILYRRFNPLAATPEVRALSVRTGVTEQMLMDASLADVQPQIDRIDNALSSILGVLPEGVVGKLLRADAEAAVQPHIDAAARGDNSVVLDSTLFNGGGVGIVSGVGPRTGSTSLTPGHIDVPAGGALPDLPDITNGTGLRDLGLEDYLNPLAPRP